MAKVIVKYRNIYLFMAILSLIGFGTGFIYYKVQSKEMKANIKETINIEEDLSGGYNNIFKSGKKALFVFGSSLLVFTSLVSVWKIFYEPFMIGFIFSFLCSYSIKMAFFYFFFYQFVPLLFLLILIKISFTISLEIIKLLFYRRRKNFERFRKLVMKYGIVLIIFMMYEFLVMIFSSNINSYLLSLIF